MNIQRFTVAVLAMFFALAGLGYVIFEIIFAEQFDSLYALMRPQAELDQGFVWTLVGRGLQVVIFGYIFLQGYENKGVMEGVRYGLMMGLFVAAIDLVWYASLPIAGVTGIALMISDVAMLTAAGAVMAAVYRPLEASE